MTTRLKYPFFEAWNESTVEVTALAIAHIERAILEQFVSAVENLKGFYCNPVNNARSTAC